MVEFTIVGSLESTEEAFCPTVEADSCEVAISMVIEQNDDFAFAAAIEGKVDWVGVAENLPTDPTQYQTTRWQRFFGGDRETFTIIGFHALLDRTMVIVNSEKASWPDAVWQVVFEASPNYLAALRGPLAEYASPEFQFICAARGIVKPLVTYQDLKQMVQEQLDGAMGATL
tara:strand:- start:1413 stop:1928 length:516 start_codon:yes stop_codon:yes gene_type:complete